MHLHRVPYLVIATLAAIAKANEDDTLSKQNNKVSETKPGVISTKAVYDNHHDSLFAVATVVGDDYEEDAPIEAPDDGAMELYQHPHIRSRKLVDLEIVPSADFTPGSFTITWPCKDKRFNRNDWVCWKLASDDKPKNPCRKYEEKLKTEDIGAPNCSWELDYVSCGTAYTVRLKTGWGNWNQWIPLTTGKCACDDPNPCMFWPPNTFFNADQRCVIEAPAQTFKTNGKWYFEISPHHDEDIFCPVIDGQQTTTENVFDCLIFEAPADRTIAIFDRGFYYSAVFAPGADLCPYRPFINSGPRNLVADSGFGFVACLVAEIPASTSSEHVFVSGQKMLIKHDYICKSKYNVQTPQGKYIKKGVYDPTEDYCFVLDENKLNDIIKGDLKGDVANNFGNDYAAGRHQFSYAACVDWTGARRRLEMGEEVDNIHAVQRSVRRGLQSGLDLLPSASRDLQAVFDPNRQALQDRAKVIVERECGAPPVCPTIDPNAGTCTPCSGSGAAQRLADLIYGTLSDETKGEIESGSLQPRSRDFGSSASADENLAENLAAGDFGNAVLPLFFLLSRWYPHGATCKNDGNHLPYMESLDWLTDSLDSCCMQHLGWAYDDCMGKGEQREPSKKFFADFYTNTCLQDCEPGPFGCALVPAPIQLYDTLEDCCVMSQSWVDVGYCTSRSVGDLTSGWVVDWALMQCVKDCDPAEGPPCAASIHAIPSARITVTAKECCETTLKWIDIDKCVANSQGVALYTDKFYVDYSTGSKCAKDCDIVSGLPCMGNPEPPLRLFDTATLCCEGSLGWIDADQCVAHTNGIALEAQGSGEWYVDWTLNDGSGKCVKDCVVGGQSCGGLKAQWDTGYPTSAACCGNISWVSSDSCHL